MVKADILSAIWKARPEKSVNLNSESATLDRLQEPQVKKGVATQDHFAGSQGRQ